MGQIAGNEHAAAPWWRELPGSIFGQPGPAIVDVRAAVFEEPKAGAWPTASSTVSQASVWRCGVVIDGSKTRGSRRRPAGTCETSRRSRRRSTSRSIATGPQPFHLSIPSSSPSMISTVSAGISSSSSSETRRTRDVPGQAGRRTRRIVGDLAEDGAGHVVGDVAAANHHNFAADIDRLIQRHGPQQVDAAVDMRTALTRQSRARVRTSRQPRG